ncbi:MAG: prepilin peptidase [Lachnospiraceae bacterium]|nr:prepilin peptidase [Lachnospiraceae bacterium]
MGVVLFLLLFCAALWDMYRARIPNILIIFGTLISVFFWISHDMETLFKRVGVSFLIFVVLYAFFTVGGLGAGDVKLLMMLVLYIKPADFLTILFISFAGAVIFKGLMIMLGRHKYCGDMTVRLSVPLFMGYGLWYICTVWRF